MANTITADEIREHFSQAMSAMYIKEHYKDLEKKVIDVSAEIDDKIARRKLESWGIEIDALTPEQETYLNSWQI